MPNVSKLTLDDITYDVKDANARKYLVQIDEEPTDATKVVIETTDEEIELATVEELNAAITAEASARTAADNTEASTRAAAITAANTRIDNIVAQAGNDNTEIVDARTGADSHVYASLKARLDAENTDLKSQLTQLDNGSITLRNWENHGITDGEDNTNRNSWVADFVKVFSKKEIVFNVSDHPGITSYVVRIVQYTADKVFIEQEDIAANLTNRHYVLNENTGYIRVQLNDWNALHNDEVLSQYFDIWFEYGLKETTEKAVEATSKAEEAKGLAEEATSKAEEAKQLASEGAYDFIGTTELISRSRIRINQSITDDANASRTDYIPVTGGERLQYSFSVTSFTSTNGSLIFGKYDENKTPIGEAQSFPFTTRDISGKWTIPDDVRFVIVAIVSWNTEASYGVASTVFEKLSVEVPSKHFEEIDDRLDALENKEIPTTYKYGEQIGNVVALADNYRGAGMTTYPKNLCLMMISDTHSDNKRVKNAIELSESMEIVDAIIHLGDTDADSPLIGSQNGMVAMMSDMTITKPFFGVIGNHDVRRFPDSTRYLDVPEAVTRYQKQLNTASMYSNRGYGYYDFTNEKIRLIILNDYDYPNTTDSDGNYVFYDRNLLFQQDQIDFFVSTLNGTPSGFTVLLASHWCDTATIDNTIYPQHNDSQNVAYTDTKLGGTTYMSDEIISEIIHAFKAKGTLTKSYTYSSGTTTGTVSVNADFSNATGLFACQICGHKHKTAIGKPDINSDYWIFVNDTSFCALGTNKWATAYSNIPRMEDTNTEDLITCLCIDTANKLIKFARIGAHMTRFADDENVRVISYDI